LGSPPVERLHPEDEAPGVAGVPNLEVMLRDGIDDLFTGDDDLAPRLGRLTTSWAELLGADACAILIEDAEKIAAGGWVVGGPKADSAPAPDPLARNVLDGVPQVYVRHDAPPTDGKAPESHPRQAIAAFPLEAVRGALWFLNLRLPVHEVDERLMVLRRSARRLGRVLALSGRVARLARDRAEALRVADLVAGMADASGRRDVEDRLRRAIANELRPELTVLRLPGSPEPEITDNLSSHLRGQVDLLLAAEEDLSSSARAALATRCEPAIKLGEATVAGLAVPIRRGNEVLGSIAVFRGGEGAGRVREWSESERRLLERLVLHAAGALALADVTDEAPATTGGEILDRRGLMAILRTEVKRAERYSVPFLLTVFELDPMPAAPNPDEELLQAFARKLRPRLRDLDAVARVGHRRFAVLNPHTDRSGGRVVLRARETLVQIANEYPAARGLDVRGNQVVFPGDVATLDELAARLGP
jgi:GAF domain-containing protein